MQFRTAINCMDGRVQLPVIEFLKKRFNARNVAVISEAGPNLILTEKTNPKVVEAIFNRVNISVNKHQSKGIAIVGHYDFAGNPSDKPAQLTHIHDSVALIKEHYPNIKIIGLWVDKNWSVNEISNKEKQ